MHQGQRAPIGQRTRTTGSERSLNHRLSWRSPPWTHFLDQPRALRPTEGQYPPPRIAHCVCVCVWGRHYVTPRQTCPQPDGFGRNLRSKTRWFTGFCNSHQVSHFATFFIDARAEISVAESRYWLQKDNIASHAHRFRGRKSKVYVSSSLGQFCPGVRCSIENRACTNHTPAKGIESRTCFSRQRGDNNCANTVLTPQNVHKFTGRFARQVSTMILPQVHLRKPCYDFSFL